MNYSLILLFVFVSLVQVFSQEIDEDGYSYAIWISKYEKGWIDSENIIWLCKASDLENGLTIESLDPIVLVVRDAYVMKNCCSDTSFKTNSFQNVDEGISDEINLFQQKETFKFKYKKYTIRVLAIKQGNCKCSSEYITEYSGIRPPITIVTLLNYQTVKLTKKEKSIFRKNKKILAEALSVRN